MKKELSFIRKKLGKNTNRGFSVAELLLVVAILFILFGVGAIAGTNIIKSTRQKNMDKRAEVIYYAAESRMMELFVTKTEEELKGSGIKGGVTTSVDGTTVSYVTSAGPDDPKNILLADKTLAAELGEGSKWVIEYDPVSLDVYSVIISEKSSNYSLGDIYSNGSATSGVRGTASERKNAFNAQVGYYCAGAGTTATELEKSQNGFLAGAWILNKRDLLGIIKLSVTQDTYNEIGANDIKFKVTLKGSKSNVEYDLPSNVIKWTDLNNVETTSSTGILSRSAFGAATDSSGKYVLTGTIILDSLKTTAEVDNSHQFKDIIGASGLIPGEDIILVVDVMDIAGSDGTTKVRGIEAVSNEENSLFATDSKDDKAYIEYPRHLQNLAETYSNYNSTGTLSNTLNAVVKADIKWDEDENLKGGAIRDFKPITNTSGRANIASFDAAIKGSSPADCYTIERIKVPATEASGGLFGTINAVSTFGVTTKISNVKLLDFDISASGNAGALAGAMTGVQVKNVIAYNTNTSDDSALGIIGGTATGGLIGSMTGGKAEGCAAALYVSSSGDCGGLIGNAGGGAEITASYSGGHTINQGVYSDSTTGAGRINVQGSNAGGLVGASTGATISNCYSTCSAAGSATTGGLVGVASGGSITDCYAVGSVKNGNGAGAICGSSSASFGGSNYYIGLVNEMYDSTDGYTYIKGIGGATENPTGIVALDEDDEEDGGQTAVEKYNAFMRSQEKMTAITSASKEANGYAVPYDSALGYRYEIKTVKDLTGSIEGLFTATHYGDWPVPENIVYNNAGIAKAGTVASLNREKGIFTILKVRAMSDDVPVADEVSEGTQDGSESDGFEGGEQAETAGENNENGNIDGAGNEETENVGESSENNEVEETPAESEGNNSENEENNSEGNGSEDSNSEENHSEEGNSEEGNSEEGNSEEGNSEEGNSEEGNSEEGNSEENNSEENASEENNSEQSQGEAENPENNSGDSGSEGETNQEDAGNSEGSGESQENSDQSGETASDSEAGNGESTDQNEENASGENNSDSGDGSGEATSEDNSAESGSQEQASDGTSEEGQGTSDDAQTGDDSEKAEDADSKDATADGEDGLAVTKTVLEEEEEEEEEEEAEIIEGEMMSPEELVKIVFGKDAKIPEGAEVVVREITVDDEGYDGYVSDAADALDMSVEDVASFKVLDIKIMKDGEEIQPESTVNVEIDTEKLYENNEVFTDDDISAVHIKDDAEAEVLNTEVTNSEGETANTDEVTASTEAASSFSFDTDGFSVYVFVQPIKEKIVAASDNNTYEITVNYDNVSGIPAGSELVVEEINNESEEYKGYIEESAEKLEASSDDFWFAHAFDIYFRDPETGDHYQPTKDVSVSIKLMQEDVNEERPMSVLHFGDETEVMDCSVNEDAVTFNADGFSVYVVIGHEGEDEVATPHVEFHFLSEEYTVLPGGKHSAGSYSFINKAGTYQTSEIIKNGESLEAIKNPPNKVIDDGAGNDVEQYFYGWYVVNYDSTDGNGQTVYSWSEDPEQVVFGQPASITPPTNGRVGENVTWTINGVTGTAVLDRDGCAHVYLAPIYEDYYFVNFHMGAKEDTTLRSSLLLRKMVVLGSDEKVTVRIGNVSATSTDSTHKVFAGWETVTSTFDTAVTYYSVDASTGQENNSEGRTDGYYVTFNKSDFNDENIDLYPIFAEARWIYFNTGKSGNNAKYIGPQYLLTSDDDDSYYLASLPDNTQAIRSGFDFQGWYADAYLDSEGNIMNLTSSYTASDGQGGSTTYPQATKIANADGTLNDCIKYDTDGTTVLYKIEDGKLHLYKALDSLTLYAHWKEYDDTTFTVIVWKQKITDSKTATAEQKKYDYEESYLNIPASSSYELADLDLATYKAFNFTGFHYARTNMSTRTVAGDGTTVVNVYYDRDLMTINFNPNGQNVNLPGATTVYNYTATTGNSGTQYGYVDGEYVELTRRSVQQTVWYFRYVYTQATYIWGTSYRLYANTKTYTDNNIGGTTYRRSDGSSTNNRYNGTRYTRSGSNYTNYTYTATSATSGNLFGVDSNGGYVELSSSNNTTYVWEYTANGNTVTYEGTRYTRSTANSVLQWTGLYGQTFEQNGYSWATVEGYTWNEQSNGRGTTQTMLYGFVQTANPYNLYYQGNSGSNYIYHYRQQLDGTYTESDRSAARTSNSSSNFNFTNKFDGFTVASYSTNTEGFRTGGGSHSVIADQTSVTLNTPFYVYHTRNSYQLTFDVNYPNDVNISFSNGQSENKEFTVKFDAPLTEFSGNGSNYFEPIAPDNYTFDGWFEDETGTEPFDFTQKMPAAGLAIYAKWSPLKYRIQIDPNGGEIDHVNHTVYDNGGYSGYAGFATFRNDNTGYNRSQSTYINATYGTVITEYDIQRNFVPISDVAAAEYTGTIYYYINTQYMETDGSGLPSDLRNALYVTEAEIDEYYDFYHDWTQGNIDGGYITGTSLLGREAWKYLYVSSQKYRERYPGENYQFLGWYRLDSNGNPQAMPYDFSQPVSEPFTIRAYWRLDGGYNIEYVPEFKDTSNGSTTLINGNLVQWRDPAVNESNYADGASTNILQQPTGLTVNGASSDEYIFRGWRLVSKSIDTNGEAVYTPLENNVFYDPGDPFVIHADYADSTGTIYMQAYYEERDSSFRRPHIANLTLDANTGFITLDGTNELDTNTDITDTWSGVIGKVTATVNSDAGDTELIEFGDIQSNEEVHLYRYATDLTEDAQGNALTDAKNYFKNANNYFLIGFDDASDEGDFIASYPADAIIAVQRTDNQTIYAVWEPLVYLNFKNEATGDVTFGLSSNDSSALRVINVKNGRYDRTPVADINNITVPAGETLKLAIPYGAGKQINIKGINTLGPGTTLLWESDAENDPSIGFAENDEEFEFTETPIVDVTGITVTFTSKQHDRTIVLHENYGEDNTRELYFENSDMDCILPATSTRLGYQFDGWSLNPDAQEAEYSSDNNYTISDLNAFFGNDNIKHLYAVWKARAEAQTVYVYKEVPKPGDTNKEFNFTVSFEGRCHNDYSQQRNISKQTSSTMKLKNGQYIKVFSEKDLGANNKKAYIKVTITMYDANDNQVGRSTTLTWNNSRNETINFNNGYLDIVVEEADYSTDYYDTTIEVASEVPDDSFTTETRRTVWHETDAGGTLIFKNIRQAKDIKIKKEVDTNTTIKSNFSFEASYKLDGKTTTIDGFTILAGKDSDGEHIIEKVPVGAELTVRELDYYNYRTEVRATANNTPINGGVYEAETRKYNFVVPNTDNIQVIYKNILKKYIVNIYKVDQNLDPGIQAYFNLSQDANTLEMRLYPDINGGTGRFYPRLNANVETSMLYIGNYALTETWVQSGFMKLEDDITLTLTGEKDDQFNRDGKLVTNDKIHCQIKPLDKNLDGINEFDVYIINSNGAEVSFNKIDSYGNLIGNTGAGSEAWFAVYETYENAKAASVTDDKAGTSFDENDGNLETITITTGEGANEVKEQKVYATQDENGLVKFEIPSGIHYMREVKAPEGYVYDSSKYIDYGETVTSGTEPTPCIYKLIVGTEAATAEGITLPDDKEFVIQRMKDATTVDDTLDVEKFGIMNISKDTRRVILTKENSGTNVPLAGASFDIIRPDLTVLAKDRASGVGGAFYIGDLPYGIYYLHEKVAPSGSTAAGTYYKLTITADSKQLESASSLPTGTNP